MKLLKPQALMKSKNPTKRPKMLLNQGLLTALGSAVAATQAEATLVGLGGFSVSGTDNTLLVAGSGVLTLNHRSFSNSGSPGTSDGYGNYSGGSPGSRNRTGSAVGQAMASARRGAAAFTVGAGLFTSSGPLSKIIFSTYNSNRGTNSGNAVDGNDNYIPVKFSVPGLNLGNPLYGLAQVGFNQGDTTLLNFWYSDNGSGVQWDGAQASELAAIPEPGNLLATGMLLSMAAFVRKRHRRPDAQSLGALAAGVGGLIAREDESAA
jgi:hypothetical protein